MRRLSLRRSNGRRWPPRGCRWRATRGPCSSDSRTAEVVTASRFAQGARRVQRGGGAGGEERAGERGGDRDEDAERDVRGAEVEERLRLEGELGQARGREAIDEQAARPREQDSQSAAEDAGDGRLGEDQRRH